MLLLFSDWGKAFQACLILLAMLSSMGSQDARAPIGFVKRSGGCGGGYVLWRFGKGDFCCMRFSFRICSWATCEVWSLDPRLCWYGSSCSRATNGSAFPTELDAVEETRHCSESIIHIELWWYDPLG
jgi:hypothetical protein